MNSDPDEGSEGIRSGGNFINVAYFYEDL